MFTTGTPAGVAVAMPEPSRYYLKPGDVVRATIERIGTLENVVTVRALRKHIRLAFDDESRHERSLASRSPVIAAFQLRITCKAGSPTICL
jgi:hypothetical protein